MAGLGVSTLSAVELSYRTEVAGSWGIRGRGTEGKAGERILSRVGGCVLRKAKALAADEPEATAEKYLLGRAGVRLSGGRCLLSGGGVSAVNRMCWLSGVGVLSGSVTDNKCGGAYFQRWCMLSPAMTAAVKARRSAVVEVISPVKGYGESLCQ